MVSQVSDDADLALTAIAGLATAVVLTIAAIVLFFIAAAKFTNRVGKLAGQYYCVGTRSLNPQSLWPAPSPLHSGLTRLRLRHAWLPVLTSQHLNLWGRLRLI
jgi:hypothetical protein